MKYVCPCGYEYDPAVGDPDNGIVPGTPWEEVVWEDEKENFLKIIDIIADIVALGEEIEADLAEKAKDPSSGITAEDVYNPIDLSNLSFDVNLLLTWQREGENGIPVVDLALSIFEVFLDEPESNLFLLAIPNVANKYFIPILDEAEGEGEHLPIFDNLTKEELKMYKDSGKINVLIYTSLL